MPNEVAALVNRCLAGEQTAMVALVERYQGQVFGLCYRMLGHRHDAEDTAQESMVRVMRNLDSWDQERPFEPWLLAIAGNRCRTLMAAKMRRPRPAPLADVVADKTPDVQAERHLAEEVRLALEGIRDDYRRAFLLFHEQELSYAEIAEILDCPLGTVKTWVHRARRELIGQLRERHVVEGEMRPCAAKLSNSG